MTCRFTDKLIITNRNSKHLYRANPATFSPSLPASTHLFRCTCESKHRLLIKHTYFKSKRKKDYYKAYPDNKGIKMKQHCKKCLKVVPHKTQTHYLWVTTG